MNKNFCKWKRVHDTFYVWKTGCGYNKEFNNNEEEHEFRFCPFCGKKLKALSEQKLR